MTRYQSGLALGCAMLALAACEKSTGSGTPTFLVVYDGNGSTGGSVPTDVHRYLEGDTVTVLGNPGALVREGYVFAGWNDQADGSGSSYAEGQTFVMGDADVTLHARWTLHPTYRVTYDGNGSTAGLAPVDETAYDEGATVTVLGNPGNLERDGFAFAGWNLAADGTGTLYTEGQTFTVGTADVVLYATWIANATYSVTYDGNGSTGGTVPTDGASYEEGASVTVLGNPGSLVRTGFTFAGWCEDADGEGFCFAEGQSFVMGAADAVLYAQWLAIPTYGLTYDANGAGGGAVPVDGASYEEGDTVTVLGNPGDLFRNGYTFSGWSLTTDGTGTSYTQGQTFAMGDHDVILYARWTPIPTYTVTYEGNGATSGLAPTDSTLYQAGNLVTVLGNPGGLSLAAHAFIGWNTAPDGTGTSYTQGQTFTMGAADVVLFARWTSSPTYGVTYDPNGADLGAVPVDSTTYEQGAIVTVLGNPGALERTGFTFVGWSVNPDGSGLSYQPGHVFLMGIVNVVLYARWTSNPTYSVTYNGNLDTGGSVPVDLNHYESGATVTVRGNPGNLVKLHFQFAGWCTNDDGTGDCYTPGETFAMGGADVLLYAWWTPNPTSSVTFDGNGDTGGSVPVDPGSYEQGDVVIVPGNTGSLVTDQQQDGITLVFNCWNTEADGSGVCYEGGDTFLMGAADVTLYAHYSVIRAIGPAGGWVFYDKGDFTGGWRYLESTPSNDGTQVRWFNGVYTHTTALGQAVGDGAINTPLVVTSQGLPGPTESAYAALICSDLVVNAYDDWFLPSMDELDLMYDNLHAYGVGGFAAHGYWSSSEFEDDYRLARNQYFVTGGQGYDLKDWNNDVRCAHAF